MDSGRTRNAKKPVGDPGQDHTGTSATEMILSNVRSTAGATSLEIDVSMGGKRFRALLDSGAAYTLISPRMVERVGIPYHKKRRPIRVMLADGSSTDYGRGMINFETLDSPWTAAGITERTNIGILDLGIVDMIVGYDWLKKHNPKIDWSQNQVQQRAQTETPKKLPQSRQPRIKRIQCTPKQGRISMISAQKIARIYEQRPTDVGVLWVRQITQDKGKKPRKEEPEESKTPRLPPEYQEFEHLTKETKDGDLAEHQEWDHEIHLEEGAKLRPGPIYQLTYEQSEELKKYIQKNVKRGYIRPSESSMASPILFVPKKNGKLRLCVDYRQLNNVTKKNSYPLPLITELMDRLQGVKWITKYDIREGYHRIRIAKGHEWLTAFKTRYGLYEYCVMPFGLTNAPATFQALVNKALHEYLDVFCTAYLDDILVYGKGTLEEHIKDNKKVLRKLQEYKLLLNPDKCEFHVKETEYLGFIISEKGIAMDPKKVEAVREWPTPKTVKDVQSFLGFANFYRKFIKGYSNTTAPLTEITKQEIGFHWDRKQKEAFEKLKKDFTSAPMLMMYDPEKKLRMETDASDYALGAVLYQKDGRYWKPIFYHSRKFTKEELNYDVHDKELLAIVDAFGQWRAQLQGAKHEVEVFSDHQNLTAFTTTKKLNRRQVRWAELLSDYKFKIFHQKGSLNGAADALSRRSDYMETDKPDMHDAILKKGQDGTMQYNQPRIAAVQAELEGKWKIRIEDHIRNWHGQDYLRLDKQEQNCYNEAREKQYVPEQFREQLIKEMHESKSWGHPGVRETVRRLTSQWAFPQVRKRVEEVVNKCIGCQQNKPKRHKPYGLLQPLEAPERPWESVTMDFIVKLPKSTEPGSDRECDSILVIVDRLTKFAYFIPTEESITAEEMAYEVQRTLSANHGMPRKLVSDRDKLFTSKYWKTLLAELGVHQKLSTSFHPQTDGQTERTNQTLEQYLRMHINEAQDNWVELLPTAQMAYNATRSNTTGYSPFYANYGYEPELFKQPRSIDSIAESAEHKAQLLQELHQKLSNAINQRNRQSAVQANKHRIVGPTLEEGGKVFISRKNLNRKRPSKKLDHLRLGPFQIAEVMGPTHFRLQLPSKIKIHPVFHKSLLEPAPKDAKLATELQLELDEEFEVERIEDCRKFGRQMKYLIKWEGWPTSQNTWEPLKNLKHCQRMVKQFHQRQERQTNRNLDPRVQVAALSPRPERKKRQGWKKNQPPLSQVSPVEKSESTPSHTKTVDANQQQQVACADGAREHAPQWWPLRQPREESEDEPGTDESIPSQSALRQYHNRQDGKKDTPRTSQIEYPTNSGGFEEDSYDRERSSHSPENESLESDADDGRWKKRRALRNEPWACWLEGSGRKKGYELTGLWGNPELYTQSSCGTVAKTCDYRDDSQEGRASVTNTQKETWRSCEGRPDGHDESQDQPDHVMAGTSREEGAPWCSGVHGRESMEQYGAGKSRATKCSMVLQGARTG
jgi:hypothetical protein